MPTPAISIFLFGPRPLFGRYRVCWLLTDQAAILSALCCMSGLLDIGARRRPSLGSPAPMKQFREELGKENKARRRRERTFGDEQVADEAFVPPLD